MQFLVSYYPYTHTYVTACGGNLLIKKHIKQANCPEARFGSLCKWVKFGLNLVTFKKCLNVFLDSGLWEPMCKNRDIACSLHS